MNQEQERTYSIPESIVFRKTDEAFGGLSNMAPGFPLLVNGVRIFTSEALYQCCRFPTSVDVQRLILGQRSPMTAKMRSKPFRHLTRADWDQIRVKVMRWCIRVKLAQNLSTFGKLLLATGTRPIVEESKKDRFWGAKVTGEQLSGYNVLGRLLMELREDLRCHGAERFVEVMPPDIPEFLLLGKAIQPVHARGFGGVQTESVGSGFRERTITIMGELADDNWKDLVHFLAAAEIRPHNARINIELEFDQRTSSVDSKLDVLENLSKRLGIHYREKPLH
ncbi:MAG: NADAR family protein [Acidobacteria bacterium]|nr:NADAR family protein [Acidobacteriota bacterium]